MGRLDRYSLLVRKRSSFFSNIREIEVVSPTSRYIWPKSIAGTMRAVFLEEALEIGLLQSFINLTDKLWILIVTL